MFWLIFVGWGITLASFIFGWLLCLRRSNKYDGIVLVMKHLDNKIVYRLETAGDPESWQYKEKVLLKIVASEEESTRE